MSNNRPSEIVLSDWTVLGVLAHRLRRELLRLCWEKPRSVGELAGILKVNPGTALYHVRRLERVGLVCIAETQRKRGVIEKRYRSVARTVDLRPPAEEATAAALAPFLSVVRASLRTIDPSLSLSRSAPFAAHVAEARIGSGEQRVVARRLAELARYIDNLPDDPDGVPMVLAAALGPQAELPHAERATPSLPKASRKGRRR